MVMVVVYTRGYEREGTMIVTVFGDGDDGGVFLYRKHEGGGPVTVMTGYGDGRRVYSEVVRER